MPTASNAGDGIVERLRASAQSAHRAQKWLADQKTARNQAAGDEHAYYDAGTVENTIEWQAADEIDRLRAVLVEAQEALRSIRAMDRYSAGTTSEDHMEYDGPCGEIARDALARIDAALQEPKS